MEKNTFDCGELREHICVWINRVEFKSHHKRVANIPQRTARHVGAIDQIPPLSQTCAGFRSYFHLRW